jgi:flagellar hook-basal body complex protein FliE
MSLNISGISPLSQIQPDVAAPAAGGSGDSSFKDVLSSAIGEVEKSHNSASKSVEQFLSGDGGDLHSTILATQRADLEFQMFMQVRNKVVSAYQEIMKMPM